MTGRGTIFPGKFIDNGIEYEEDIEKFRDKLIGKIVKHGTDLYKVFFIEMHTPLMHSISPKNFALVCSPREERTEDYLLILK